MSYGAFDDNYGQMYAADAAASERGAFIRRVYGHVFGAILAFVGLEAALLNMPGIDGVFAQIFAFRWAPLILMVMFMGAGWLARSWAHGSTSSAMQYTGLGLYVLAQAAIFAPLLYVVNNIIGDRMLIPTAGFFTLLMFAGLTAIVFVSGANFSFLRTGLMLAGFASLGVVLCAAIFGLSLGVWFSIAMAVLASGYILYDTSEILHTYRTDQHVGAALELFASVAILFYYIVRILMSFRSDD